MYLMSLISRPRYKELSEKKNMTIMSHNFCSSKLPWSAWRISSGPRPRRGRRGVRRSVRS
jgi:hypothetical protein